MDGQTDGQTVVTYCFSFPTNAVCKEHTTAINLAIGIVNISHVSDSARKCCKNVRI